MADIPKRGNTPLALTTSVQTAYTAPNPGGNYAMLSHIHCCNESDVEVLVTIGMDTAGTDGAGERIWYKMRVPGNGVVSEDVEIPLTIGATPSIVYALADANSRAVLILNVWEG
jgi:hypothetical protein